MERISIEKKTKMKIMKKRLNEIKSRIASLDEQVKGLTDNGKKKRNHWIILKN